MRHTRLIGEASYGRWGATYRLGGATGDYDRAAPQAWLACVANQPDEGAARREVAARLTTTGWSETDVGAEALGWGALAASSLMIGALLALPRRWPDAGVGLVLAFGAGALISSVSFELAEEGTKVGDPVWVGLGLGIGAFAYFLADGALARRTAGGRGAAGRRGASNAGSALALGALLDGIPEQMVLGIGIAAGNGVGLGLLVAIWVSNLPEAIGSASDMKASGREQSAIIRLWGIVAVVCVVASVIGYAIADAASDDVKAAIDGFAAGALLVMLVDSMIPEATRKFGRKAGLVTALGFAIAAALSGLSA
jgi:ZIP family zinc transporter